MSRRLHSQENQTVQEVKQEVLEHLREMELLNQSIPSAIIISPFEVSVEVVQAKPGEETQSPRQCSAGPTRSEVTSTDTGCESVFIRTRNIFIKSECIAVM